MTHSDNLNDVIDTSATATGNAGQPTAGVHKSMSRHGLLAACFELMGEVLGPFIDENMSGYFEDEESWAEAAANRLGRANEHGDTDPLFQLLVLRRFWGPIFARHFDTDLRGIIGELIDTRNMWAHLNLPDDANALDRSVLAIERLISPLAPSRCRELRTVRAEIRSLGDSSLEPAMTSTIEPFENAISDSDISNDDVDVLIAQLAETEAVFDELKAQHAEVTSRLETSRQKTAERQMHLQAVQQQLALIQSRTAAAESILAEERTVRHRIEWLAVGLLATLTLFMVLTGTVL